MSQFYEECCRPDVAAGAIGQHLRVKTPGALVVAGSTDNDIGTMENPCLAAGPCTVRLRTAEGTQKFVALEAITKGNPFYAAAGGKVAASGTITVGTALETTTADGDVFEGLRLGNADVSGSVGGTTAAAFLVDSDSATPRIELAAQTGGTGNFKQTIKPAATLTADRVVTLPPDVSVTLASVTGTETLTNKTLTSPVINTPTVKDLTEVVSATNVITAAETGSVFFLNSATEFVSTLPAPAAGLKFTFIVTAAPSGASYTIVTNSSSNIIKGQAYTSDVNSATDADFETAGCDTISFVDSKSVAGDRVDLVCDGTNWFAYGFSSVFDAITFTTAS